ncbi:MAG: hypothetical protein ACRD20_20575 [Terriglobales bacterium]
MESVRDYLAKIGKKGGKARLVKMSAEERKEIARRGAQARWGTKKKKQSKSRP